MKSKVATIVPLNHLELTAEDEYFMALSHAAENPNYRAFFRRMSDLGKHVILDNSAIEMGHPETFESYLSKAVDMRVSQIMMPDIFMDAPATFNIAREKLAEHRKGLISCGFGIIVIPQGEFFEEWAYSAGQLYKLVSDAGLFPTIGVSCRYTSMFGGNRIPAVEGLLSSLPEAKIHLLGCYANPILEVAPLLKMARVMGVDSSYPSVYTQHKLQLKHEDFFNERPARNIDFLEDSYDEELLRNNIAAWRYACQPQTTN